MSHDRQVFSHNRPATELGTRQALAEIAAQLSALLPAEKAGIAEIALAEILNNIVEHAYAGTSVGEFQISAHISGSILRFEIRDQGVPMPRLTLPPGRDQDLSVSRENLPEGGFGWMLIRSIARDLEYSRIENSNILHFTLDCGES